MIDFTFAWHGLSAETVTRFFRVFGSLSAGGVFTPYDLASSTFELVAGDRLAATGMPRLTLSDALIAGDDGRIDFAIDPAAFFEAGFTVNQTIHAVVKRIVSGVRDDWMRGTILFEGKPVSA